jgi:hypothetical protein
MALPWSAPSFGQGIFPSQAPFFIPDKVDPRLVASIAAQREQNQQEIAGSIQNIMAGLGKIVEQRRQDAIASQLLAGSAPKAEAVGGQAPAAQPIPAAVDPAYAQRGLDLTPTGQPIAPATPPASLAAFSPVGAGVPSTALSAAEAAQNRALGFPAQQLMRPSEIYSAREKLYDQSLSDQYKQAQIAHLMGVGAGGRYGSSNVVTGPNGQPMTLHDAFRLAHPELEKTTPDPWERAIVKRRGWIDKDGLFTTEPPKGSEGANAAQGPYAEVQFPGQKTPVTVPFGAIPQKGATGGGATGRAPAQVGEKRMFGTEVRVWNGSQWVTASNG